MTSRLNRVPLKRASDLLERLDNLMESDREGPHVSIYCPTGQLPGDVEKASQAFRAASEAALRQLEEDGRASGEVSDLLNHVAVLADDRDFWLHQSGGIAVFLNREEIIILEIPSELPSICVVSSGFFLKPLLALAANLDVFYLLAMGKDRVSLYRGSELGLREVDCPGLPDQFPGHIREGLEDSGLKEREAKGRTDRTDSGESSSEPRTGEEAVGDDLSMVFRTINRAVSAYLSDRDLPLLVAGDSRYESIYRQINSYPNLSEAYLDVEVEEMEPEVLAELARKALRHDFLESQKRALLRFKKGKDLNEGNVARGLEDVLVAASDHRVEVGFLPSDLNVWGAYDPSQGSVTRAESPSSTATELNELAARIILANGGEVFFLEERQLPTDSKAIALLRPRQLSPRSEA